LLDGTLVRERLLDRKRLVSALSGRPERVSVVVGDVMAYLSKEIWLQRWGFGSGGRRAAA
jgi:hypothetical protein